MYGDNFRPNLSSTTFRVNEVFGNQLGFTFYLQNDLIALSASDLGLPDTDSLLTNVKSQFFPEVLAFAAACLSIACGVLLVKAFYGK